MSVFTEHTLQSAPVAARRTMTAIRDHFGHLPSAVARWAESPELLEGFTKLNAMFESCSLDPLSVEVVVMTIAVRNGCELCVAIHTARLRSLDAPDAIIAALRAGDAVPDPRLEAVRAFTVRLLDTTGDAGDEAVQDFLDAGFTARNALEIVLGIGTYTMSTFANRLTGAPVDEQLR
jgi:AhpD family alkylhydroperoxidase